MSALARASIRLVGSGGGGGGGGTPDAITALGAKAWVSAASVAPVADGTNVPFLPDLTGNGHHAKQLPAGGSIYKPGVTPNGGPALQQQAGRGYSMPHTSLFGAAAEGHVFGYVKSLGVPQEGPWQIPYRDDFPWGNGTWYSNTFGGEWGHAGAGVNVWDIFEVRHSITTRTIRHNGVDKISGASTFAKPYRVTLGGTPTTGIYLAGVVIFDVALDDTDAAAVRAALQEVFGSVA